MDTEELVDEAEPQIVAVPVTIHTDVPPFRFVVHDVDAWSYQELGIFAMGSWYGDGPDVDRSVLIPYSQIRYLEFNYDSLIEFRTDEFINDALSGEDSDA